jgi:hypothetical protein
MTLVTSTLLACALLLPQQAPAFLAAASVSDHLPAAAPSEAACLELLPAALAIEDMGYRKALAVFRGVQRELAPPLLPDLPGIDDARATPVASAR